LARGATSNVQDEFTLLGSVGISDVLRLVASATSDRNETPEDMLSAQIRSLGFV
jgi:hypothetical protein